MTKLEFLKTIKSYFTNVEETVEDTFEDLKSNDGRIYRAAQFVEGEAIVEITDAGEIPVEDGKIEFPEFVLEVKEGLILSVEAIEEDAPEDAPEDVVEDDTELDNEVFESINDTFKSINNAFESVKSENKELKSELESLKSELESLKLIFDTVESKLEVEETKTEVKYKTPLQKLMDNKNK